MPLVLEAGDAWAAARVNKGAARDAPATRLWARAGPVTAEEVERRQVAHRGEGRLYGRDVLKGEDVWHESPGGEGAAEGAEGGEADIGGGEGGGDVLLREARLGEGAC